MQPHHGETFIQLPLVKEIPQYETIHQTYELKLCLRNCYVAGAEDV